MCYFKKNKHSHTLTHTAISCENSIHSHLDTVSTHSYAAVVLRNLNVLEQSKVTLKYFTLFGLRKAPTQSQLLKMLIGKRFVPEETQLWIREASCHLVSMHESTSVWMFHLKVNLHRMQSLFTNSIMVQKKHFIYLKKKGEKNNQFFQ